jgi:hypothetical protein
VTEWIEMRLTFTMLSQAGECTPSVKFIAALVGYGLAGSAYPDFNNEKPPFLMSKQESRSPYLASSG